MRRILPRHAHAPSALFDLDFGEARLGQEVREFANDLCVDLGLWLRLAGIGKARPELPYVFDHWLPAFTILASASRARRYPGAPKPQITPFAASLMNECRRYGSRAKGLDRCTSMSGIVSARQASRRAMEVWL